ncbi:MAG: hypothetical protein EU529_00785 [Promethearchaeota archaeon]|nr:MAG: hypothetical protein EU529_00785 [Candidatus Lokiarchaeota archaeon]
MGLNWIKNSCNNCGECCMRNPTIELIDEKEWKKILTFIKEKYEGKLHVIDFNPTLKRYLKLSFKPKLNDLSLNSFSELFLILDDEINPCPFLNFDRIEAKYYCMIQEIKPQTCINWFCEPPESVDSEFNKCVLNFGKKKEYPPCKECQESGFDEENPRIMGEPTECEMGKGCRYLERRIRYFLNYAKNNPIKKKTRIHAKRLIDILKKQHKIFQTLLFKTDLGLTKEEINLNQNKYLDLVTDIKMIIEDI